MFALVGMLVVTEYTAEQYIKAVLSGKQVTGQLVRLAMERHVNDLERQGDKDFPYYFDASRAKRVIDFKQQLHHVEGKWKGARLELEPWQQAADWIMFGWVKEDGNRRFTKALRSVGRKNGKTTEGGAIADYMFYADVPRENGPQVYFLGPIKAQGKYGWKRAVAMIRANAALAKRAKIYKEQTNEPVVNLITDDLAVMTVWGRDAATRDGFSPTLALVDEGHLYPDNEAMEVIESGEGAREQPLILIITTAGFNLNSPCYIEEWSLAVDMLHGTRPMLEHYFSMIYTIDEGDDPFADPSCWIKANPNLGVSCRLDYLRERVETALSMPTKLNGVLTKNFNVWTQAETRWIALDKWAACGLRPINEDALAGRPCYGGLDLSTSIDITAWVLCFPPLPGEDRYRLLPRFFIPADGIVERERRDRVPYSLWISQGLIKTCAGSTISFDDIEDQIRADAKKFVLVESAYDPWKAEEIVQHLDGEGLRMIEYRQNATHMSSPTEMFEKAVLSETLDHGGNPVLIWMMGCTEVRSDSRGNILPIKPDRKTYGKRIDGVIASIEAYHRAAIRGDRRSVYEERGVIVG